MEIIANTSKSVHATHAVTLSLFENYVHELNYMLRQPGVFQSDLQFFIRYAPASKVEKKEAKPFLLKVDFFDTIELGSHRFESFEAFCNDETFGFTAPFFIKYTCLSQDLFDLAEANPYCYIPLGFNIKKYIDNVKEKYKREHNGEEIKNFTFFSEEYLLANAYLCEDKIAARKASKNKKLKGVVEKCE